MSFSYRIDPAGAFVEVVIAGPIAVADVISGIRDLIDDTAFDPLYDILVDCSTARIGKVSFDLPEAIIEITQAAHGGRRALVPPDGDGGAHIAKYIALRGDPENVRGFASRADAEAWLKGS